jgi:glycosyltransferase involved in cell wall biosynthesis
MSVPVDGINLCGYLKTESGVGTAARRYLRALRALGVPLTLHDVSHLQTNRARDDTVRVGAAAELHTVNIVCADVELHFTILAHLGESFFRDRYNIGVWAWELPRFPHKWLDRFAYYDEIWVGTSFIAAALAPIAPVPVVRIPPVLTPDAAGSRARGRARLGVHGSECLFLFVFDFHSHCARKNPLAVMHAFRRAFAPGDGARLVLKCVNADARPDDFARMQELARGYPIDIHEGYWPAADVHDLMAACDTYVSLHRSEGTGLTISDAMALGTPVIATGWSGNMDFMTVANSYPVRYELVELERSVGPYGAGEVWADPSVEHAAEQMRLVFDDRDGARARGMAARRDIETAYSEDAVARLIDTRLNTIGVRQRWPAFRDEVAKTFAGYRRLPAKLEAAVRKVVPDGATVLVVSKGDEALLALQGRTGWHFPRLDDGRYAGFYPEDSTAAIDHLEMLRARGAEFLLLPQPAFWWLEHYGDFAQHLAARYTRVLKDEDCIIYALTAPAVRTSSRAKALRDEIEAMARPAQALAGLQTRARSSAGDGERSGQAAQYQRLVQEIRKAIPRCVPRGSTVLVVSRGDGELLKLRGLTAWHFPRTKNGTYAGHHPADSVEAIEHLEALRDKGAGFLFFPRTACWWLEHYAQLRRHLDRHYRSLWRNDHGILYALADADAPPRKKAAHVA